MIRMYGAKDLDIREIFDIEEFNIIQEYVIHNIFSLKLTYMALILLLLFTYTQHFFFFFFNIN